MDPASQITDSCIEWDRSHNLKGYGQRRIAGKLCSVARLAYEELHGPIPKERFLLHRCDNPPCFNVDHLYVGTAAENTRDMMTRGRNSNQNRSKLKCKNGHDLADENLVASFLRRGQRVCKICRNRWQKTHRTLRGAPP
ncbi:MAG: HNH endonuclease signature motif containing protein [Nitrospiraceae bacterium]